jgi:hypothetical protein
VSTSATHRPCYAACWRDRPGPRNGEVPRAPRSRHHLGGPSGGVDRTSKLTVHDRVPVRSLAPALLAGYSANSPFLVACTLLDPVIARRNRFTLKWDRCWELHAPPVPEDPWPVQITVAFNDPVPLRPERLMAHGLGISRNEIARRVKIDIPLNRRTIRDFSLVVF